MEREIIDIAIESTDRLRKFEGTTSIINQIESSTYELLVKKLVEEKAQISTIDWTH